MRIVAVLGQTLRSRSLVLVLLIGNLALGLTTLVQADVIQGQKRLIHLLYHDSNELAAFKIAENSAKARRH